MVTSLSIEHQPRHDGPWIGGLLLSLNAVGVAAYLWWASKTWPIPEEAGLCSQTMEPILWVVGCIPLFIGFAIINLGWWLVARWARSPEDTRKRWPARALVALIWVLAYVIDDVHQRAWAENCPPGKASEVR